ncbi:hypothetical protein K466DRAFT_583839 [Polyporus arcularius HHB13444]|uniref:Uncharacterized protein n=1 Tax=Polyporus arcularius HHB13444 TaxID=1314778 RepID=A0A5C3PKJ2_9APHY|nr:hypothetical protein K466DRAFT_583839 [Polyporus arcularius HHB13444]
MAAKRLRTMARAVGRGSVRAPTKPAEIRAGAEEGGRGSQSAPWRPLRCARPPSHPGPSSFTGRPRSNPIRAARGAQLLRCRR